MMTDHKASSGGSPTPAAFRKTIGYLPTGVTVILVETGGQVHGMTASAVSSLSLDPMLILFCVGTNAKMAAWAKRAGFFTVNILAENQEAIANHFAGIKKEQEAGFDLIPWNRGRRLAGSVAALFCARRDILEGGDHLIVLGQVRELHIEASAPRPLVVFAGSYRALKPRPVAPAPEWLSTSAGTPHIFYDPWEDG